MNTQTLIEKIEGMKTQEPYTFDDDMCKALDDVLKIVREYE